MIEEISGMFLSLFSFLVRETPRVSYREETNETSDTVEEVGEVDKWLPYINEEYENVSQTNQMLGSLLDYRITESYEWLDAASSGRGVYFKKSIQKSLSTTLALTFVMLPLSAFAMLFVYFDLNTTDLCVEWQYSTLSLSVRRLRVVGESVKAVIINLSFPLTIAVLFGWKKFKLKFFSTFLIALISGEAIVIYYLFLLAYGLYARHVYYGYPANVITFAALICSSIVMLRNIRRSRQAILYSNGHIFVLVSTQFVLSFIFAVTCRYAIVPYFNAIKQRNHKFLAAAMVPALTFIPTVICKHIALRRSSELVHPGRSFALVYFFRGVGIFLFRIMQADFKNIWLFIGLSLLSGVLKFLKKATYQLRMNLWRKFIYLLKRTVCCRRLDEMPSNTAHYRRLKADLEIQDMLFEISILVSSQGYYLLYHVENFDVAVSSYLYKSLKKIAVAVGIDFLFNYISNFVEIHIHNIPISRVWRKYWKRHVLANFIIVIVVVSYFTPVLLSVFQARGTTDGQYAVRNCTIS